jgi:hypothetical protein
MTQPSSNLQPPFEEQLGALGSQFKAMQLKRELLLYLTHVSQ